jgi:hypothetical protein
VTEPSFELRWQPTRKDYEIAVAAKRRATRAIWLDRAMSWGILLLGVLSIAAGDVWGGLPVALIGLLLVTGLWSRAYRWLFFFRRHPAAFAPTHTTLTADEFIDVADGAVQRYNWSFWRALIHLPDRLVLLTRPTGAASMMTIPRHGLANTGQWDELVRFVEARVPDHPRDLHPRPGGALDPAGPAAASRSRASDLPDR